VNLQLEKKHYLIILGAFLLAILFYLGAYYLYLNPLKTSLLLKESQLKTEQQLTEALETRVASVNESDFSSTAELQKKLPVDPMVDQLVLDFEKAEVISDTFITSIEFNEGDQTTSTIEEGAGQQEDSSVLQNEQADVLDTQQAEEAQSDNLGASTDEQDKGNLMNMPEGLATTTATIIVEAEKYLDLEKFIETLENLQRIVVVKSISFNGPEEIFTLADESERIEMTLTVNALYYPELKDLKDYSPKVQVPEPANKRDPFPSFGDVSEDGTENNQN
jgi:type IV pilus assembly protein PilO